MQLKKELKTTKVENETLRYALSEFAAGTGQGSEAAVHALELLMNKTATISAPATRSPSANAVAHETATIKLPALG